jgi:hypothetical protein
MAVRRVVRFGGDGRVPGGGSALGVEVGPRLAIGVDRPSSSARSTTNGSRLPGGDLVGHASASASRALRASSCVALGRQRPHDRVEQVAGAAAVRRGDRVGLVPAERVELAPSSSRFSLSALLTATMTGAGARRSSSAASSSAGVMPARRRRRRRR